MRWFVSGLIVALLLLHQDFWNWHTHNPLVFGFIPIGLAWHVGISLMAGLSGGLAVTYCWPANVDVADSPEPAAPTRRGDGA